MTPGEYWVVIFRVESKGARGESVEKRSSSCSVSRVLVWGAVRRWVQSISVSSSICIADRSTKACSAVQLGSLFLSWPCSMESSMKKKTKPTDTVTENDRIV